MFHAFDGTPEIERRVLNTFWICVTAPPPLSEPDRYRSVAFGPRKLGWGAPRSRLSDTLIDGWPESCHPSYSCPGALKRGPFSGIPSCKSSRPNTQPPAHRLSEGKKPKRIIGGIVLGGGRLQMSLFRLGTVSHHPV